MRLENGIEQGGLLLWRGFDLNMKNDYELFVKHGRISMTLSRQQAGMPC